jgi:hypothetical protein
MIFYEQLQLVSYYLLLVQVTVEHTYQAAQDCILQFIILYKKEKRKILLCFGSSTK